MTTPLFLVDADRLQADRILLVGDEGRHAAVVRRIRLGEQVDLCDGNGHVARCRVVQTGRTEVECQVHDRIDVPAPAPRIVVAQALAKGDRAELAVELMTEVGVDEIVPWTASRNVTRWDGERGATALRRWRSTAREAAKQSRRAWLPVVAELASTRQLVQRLPTAALAVVLHEEATTPIAAAQVPVQGDVLLVVGPEGGIDQDELAAFSAAGAHRLALGPTVLRTSSAGAVAAAVLLSRTARWASGR